MRNSVLYHHQMSSPSRKARIAILEKNIATIEFKSVDIINGEQFEDWFLKLNPKGEVPVLVHYDEEDNQTIVNESTDIMKFIDAKYPSPPKLFTESEEEKELQGILDTLGTFVLTWGAFSHYQSLSEYTKVIRYPYCNFIKYHSMVKRRMFVEKPQTLLSISERVGPSHPAHEMLKNKANHLNTIKSIFYDSSEFESKIFTQVEKLMERIEGILSREERSGPFLLGPVFGGLDISLTAFLFRLYQLGMDEYFWGNGNRPHLSVYYDMVMKRPSVMKGTEDERQHSHEKYEIGGPLDSQWALTGFLGVLCLSSIYLFRKLRK